MTTHPQKKPETKAQRRLAARLAPFDAQSKAGQMLRDLVSKGAFHRPGSLK